MHARQIAREFALLTLPHLLQKQKEVETVGIGELLEQTIRLLVSESTENLKAAGKELEAANDKLFEADLRHENLDTVKNYLRESTEKVEKSINFVSFALEWPLFRTLADMPEIRKLAVRLIKHFKEHQPFIDKTIDEVSPEWPLERMSSIDRDLVRLAAAEMCYIKDTPVPVAINEAVELAKKYGTKDSYRFVNGVLKNLIPYAKKERSEV